MAKGRRIIAVLRRRVTCGFSRNPPFSVGVLLVSVISIFLTFCNWSKSAVLFHSTREIADELDTKVAKADVALMAWSIIP